MTLPSLSFGGLATPFDVNGLIDQIMAAEGIPLQNLQATRQSYLDKDAAWSGVVAKVSSLRSSIDSLDMAANVTAASSDTSVAAVSLTGTPSPGSLTFDIDRLARAHTVHSADTVSSPTDTVGIGTFSINAGGTDYSTTLDGSETITELAATINGWDAGVSARVLKVDDGEYSLLITADSTGDASQFSVTSLVVGFTTFNTSVTGQDSQITIGSGLDALTVERSTNTITDLMDGVTIELKGVADDVTVSTARDFEGSGDGVASVVAKLNSLLAELTKLTSYDAASGKAGILAGDSTARSLMSSLRSAVSGSVGTGTSPYVAPSIGISITRTGSFSFDQEKFEELLATDFDSVTTFFDDVLLDNLDTAVEYTEGVDGSIARARNRWKNQVDFVDDRIAALEDRLDVKEAALIRQFSALDVALQTLNSQSAWLSSQIAGFNSGS